MLAELKEKPDTIVHGSKIISQSCCKQRRGVHVSAKVYHPYIQGVVDHIKSRMSSIDLISAMSVFDPRHLPDKEEEPSGYCERSEP